MKDEPQIAARASSIGSGRRLTAANRTGGLSGFPATLGPLTQVAPEQPLHRALGLTDEELDRIRELLEREPNHFELAVFSLLWSEHCGYKHSGAAAQTASLKGERVLQGPGENAGVIDLGEGEAVAFKVESHNHPSAVEPFQGAATGVGGILRDIVAMGARPIAILDGLRFARAGPPLPPRASPGSATTATPSASRPSAAKRSSTRRTATTASSTRCAWDCCRLTELRVHGQPRSARMSSSSVRRPGATESAARRCSRAQSSARTLSRRLRRRHKAMPAWPAWPGLKTSGRPCRSAIRSRARS